MADFSTLTHVGITEPQVVSQQEFLQHITAMQQHYRAIDPTGVQPIVHYVLPDRLVLLASHLSAATGTKPPAQAVQQQNPLPPDLAAKQNFARLVALGTPAADSQAVANAIHDQHQRTLQFINSHRDAMLQATTAAQKAPGTQAFVQQMDALRNQAKTNHEARIDAMFAALSALGTAHPAARPVVLATGNKVGEFVAGVAAEATKVAGTVKSAVAAGGAAIGKAAESVGDWGSGAVQKVSHFFGNLF